MVFFSAADPPSRDLECPRAPLAPLCAPQPHIVRTHTETNSYRLESGCGSNGSPAVPWRPARRSAVRTPRPLRARRPRPMARNIKQMSDRCDPVQRGTLPGRRGRGGAGGAGRGGSRVSRHPSVRSRLPVIYTHAHSNTPHPRALARPRPRHTRLRALRQRPAERSTGTTRSLAGISSRFRFEIVDRFPGLLRSKSARGCRALAGGALWRAPRRR